MSASTASPAGGAGPELGSLRCMVLGGGGFIGTNLCRSLVGRCERVGAFGRRQSYPEALAEVEWYSGDFGDTTSLAAAVDGFDVVFHLVNSTTPATSNIDKLADLRTSVEPTLNLLEICRQQGVRRVVFVSSGGTVYGIPDAVPTPETAPTWPIAAYGVAKLTIERYLHLYGYLHGLDHRILRVANPYGPYQLAAKNQGVIAAFLRRALAGRQLEVWGDGSVARDYVYIDDVVEALQLAAVHQGEGRVFNVGSGEARSLNDVLAAIRAVVPGELDVAWRPGRPLDVPVSALDCTRAREELGWIPRTQFEEGLRRTLDWLKERPSP